MSQKDSNNTIEALHGGDVYRNEVRLDFSVNLDPLPMPETVREAMLKGIDEIHQYPDPVQQELNAKIGVFEGVSPERIICGNGASELLMAAVHAVKPKKALIAAPCYAGYAVALKAEDAEIKEYFLDDGKEFAVDEGFIGCIKDDTDMVFIADPNNPNGKLIDPKLKSEISRKCRECGAVLVIDECFYPLTEAGAVRPDHDARDEGAHQGARDGSEDHGARAAQESYDDGALHLRAFTKTFAIPGVRLGYMISTNDELMDKIRKHLPEWNVSRIAERTGEAAAEVLAETDYLERSVKLIAEERAFLSDSLTGLGIRVYPSDTNYILIRSGEDLYDRLLEKGILIRRCANFSGLDDTYFRIAVRQHPDNEELVRAISEMLMK